MNCTQQINKNGWEIDVFRIRCPDGKQWADYIQEHGREIGDEYCLTTCEDRMFCERGIKLGEGE